MQSRPKLRITGLLLCGLLALTPASAGAGSDWTPGSSAEGNGYSYQLFSQQSEEGIVRYRIRGMVDAPPAALVRAVRVIAGDPARAPAGQTRRLLSQSAAEFVVYTRIDLPPLFDDRDIVTRGASSSDGASGIQRIHWQTIDHPDAPPSAGVIRIERAEGFWVFTPGDAGTRVSYETYMDPGGALPSWLIQRILAGSVVEAFENVAREANGS